MTTPTVESHTEDLRQLPGLLEPALEKWQQQVAGLAPSLRNSVPFFIWAAACTMPLPVKER